MCSIHYDLSPTPIKYTNAKCFFKTFSAKKQRRRNQHNTYSMCIIQEIHLNNNNNNWYSVTTQYTQLNFQIHSCIESLARFSFFLLDHYYYVHFSTIITLKLYITRCWCWLQLRCFSFQLEIDLSCFSLFSLLFVNK